MTYARERKPLGSFRSKLMPTTTYITIQGEIVGEDRAGVRSDYRHPSSWPLPGPNLAVVTPTKAATLKDILPGCQQMVDGMANRLDGHGCVTYQWSYRFPQFLLKETRPSVIA